MARKPVVTPQARPLLAYGPGRGVVAVPGPGARAGRWLLLLCLLVLLPACAWTTQQKMDRFDDQFARGEFGLAATSAARHEGGGFRPGGGSNLLWTLQQAAALQAAGELRESIALYDTTEEYFRLFDEDNLLNRWGEQAGALFSNDSALAYRGTLYDAIMVNSYKALLFMALGEPDNARVELNRAGDRQRRAVASFSQQIQQEREALRERQQGEADMNSTLGSAEQRLAPEFDRLAEWSIYPAFVNPLATWLEGLFLLTSGQASGDTNRAAEAFDRALGMVPDNSTLARDRQWANDLADGRVRRGNLPPTVWVLFENGLGPVRVEQRIDIPVVFSFRDRPAIFTGLAYPALRYRNEIPGGLRVQSGAEAQRTELLSNMDAVISTEFKEQLGPIIARAVTASIARATVQYQLQRQYGDLAGFVGLIYQIVSTQADTRIWSSLPKRFDIASVPRPENDQLTLEWSGQFHQVDLPQGQFHLIWVRAPRAGAQPGIQVITL